MQEILLVLFRMVVFGTAHGWEGGICVADFREGGLFAPLPKICHTYPTMMKLGTVMMYLKDVEKLYQSHDTPL